MNAQAHPKETPSAYVAATTPEEARRLSDDLMGIMTRLLAVIEHETELVRAGKLGEAMALAPDKQQLSQRYVGAVGNLRASHQFLLQTAPELLRTLHRHHDTFRAMLQVNLTVLATAHAVSENIVRSVNAEMQRRNIPNTYTANGRPAAPGPRHVRPLTISRSM